MFYFKLKLLNDRHFETRQPSKLNEELRWALGKDFVYIEFYSNRLIYTVFIWIWNFQMAAILKKDGRWSSPKNSVEVCVKKDLKMQTFPRSPPKREREKKKERKKIVKDVFNDKLVAGFICIGLLLSLC